MNELSDSPFLIYPINTYYADEKLIFIDFYL